MFVKPAAPHLIIRDPVTRMPLPAEGAEVPDNMHWQRRLLEGRKFPGFGVVLATAPAPVQPVAAAATAPARS